MTNRAMTDRAATDRATLNPPADSARIYGFLRNAFLILMLTGYVFYPFDLWVLGHWLESWQSRIPFLVAAPSVLFTILMLFFPRNALVRQVFIILMVLNLITGLVGATLHFFWNFEGEMDWSWNGIKEAFQGTRPVLAAMAFTHIGFTGLLCSFLPSLPAPDLATAESASKSAS